jgi:hypothetical protein
MEKVRGSNPLSSTDSDIQAKSGHRGDGRSSCRHRRKRRGFCLCQTHSLDLLLADPPALLRPARISPPMHDVLPCGSLGPAGETVTLWGRSASNNGPGRRFSRRSRPPPRSCPIRLASPGRHHLTRRRDGDRQDRGAPSPLPPALDRRPPGQRLERSCQRGPGFLVRDESVGWVLVQLAVNHRTELAEHQTLHWPDMITLCTIDSLQVDPILSNPLQYRSMRRDSRIRGQRLTRQRGSIPMTPTPSALPLSATAPHADPLAVEGRAL